MIMKGIQKIIVFLILLLFVKPISSQGPSLTIASNSTTLTPLQQQISVFFSGKGLDSATLLQYFQNLDVLQILSQVPPSILESFFKQLSSGFLDPIQPNYNPYRNFSNWAETVNTDLLAILYPTGYSPYNGQQIQSIQKFVKSGAAKGKRVRSSGCRHSFSSIFSDPNQLLVSFYPPQIIDATSQAKDAYTILITKLQEELAAKNIEHLNQIRKVGEIDVPIKQKGQKCDTAKRHLVKIGASVSNSQLRMWSIKNGYQVKSNTIIDQLSFIGALATCSHGSGLQTQTLCDYVYEIQFIDHNGKRQTISKADHPNLIKTAASSLGLLGPIIFVTIQMQELQIVKIEPYVAYKDFVVPWPKNYAHKKERLLRPEWIKWQADKKPSCIEKDWSANLNRFKQSVSKTYAEWFYSPLQGIQAFQYAWQTYAPKNAQNIAKLQANKQIFINDYPIPQAVAVSQFSQFLASYFAGDLKTEKLFYSIMKNPYDLFPQESAYVNQPDAVHYIRGLHNFKLLYYQAQINIPAIKIKDKILPDYDLIQKIWWETLQIVQENIKTINYQQMRIFKGSDSILAPQYGYDYVCSIQIIRTVTITASQQQAWKKVQVQLWNAWKNLTDSKGRKVTIRPHWGKEWTEIPTVKSHVFSDQSLKNNIKKFLEDYKKIAKLKGFDYLKNLQTFSNEIYRNLLNNAIGNKGPKIN